MPPKKLSDISRTQRQDSVQSDHELFLQAFEKPTQIYRFLRLRHLALPLFLPRTLTYMPRKRDGSSKRKRERFRIDSLLARVMERHAGFATLPSPMGHMKFILLGFFDGSGLVDSVQIQLSVARVELGRLVVSFSTTIEATRNRHSSRHEIVVPDLCFGPSSLSTSAYAPLKNPSYDLQLMVRSHVLIMRVMCSNQQDVGSSGSATLENGYGEQPPPPKRLRTSAGGSTGGQKEKRGSINGGASVNGTPGPRLRSYASGSASVENASPRGHRIFGNELVIYDRCKKCLLTEGNYEILLFSAAQSAAQTNGVRSRGGNGTVQGDSDDNLGTPTGVRAQWCSADDDSKDVALTFEQSPRLCFDLEWIPVEDLQQETEVDSDDVTASTSGNKENGHPVVSAPCVVPRRTLTPRACKMNAGGNSGGSQQSNPRTSPCRASASNSLVPPDHINAPTPNTPEERKTTRVLYHFVFNGSTAGGTSGCGQATEARNDLKCPWCSVNCRQLYPLLKHLKLCHGRLRFNYVPHPQGARIDVTPNDRYDGSYAGNPQALAHGLPSLQQRLTPRTLMMADDDDDDDDTNCPVPDAFIHSHVGKPMRRTPVTHVMLCRPKRPPPSLSEFLPSSDGTDYFYNYSSPADVLLTPSGNVLRHYFVSGHNRLYYHSHSCQPIRPQEMDSDSEEENDPQWFRQITQKMIDDFTDVNEGEKEIMKMWNLHVMKCGFVGDCQIGLACSMFVEQHGREIIERNLYRNFVLHMCNLLDFGLISASGVYTTVKRLQAFAPKNGSFLRSLPPSVGGASHLHQHPVGGESSASRTCGGSPTKMAAGSSYHLHH